MTISGGQIKGGKFVKFHDWSQNSIIFCTFVLFHDFFHDFSHDCSHFPHLCEKPVEHINDISKDNSVLQAWLKLMMDFIANT